MSHLECQAIQPWNVSFAVIISSAPRDQSATIESTQCPAAASAEIAALKRGGHDDSTYQLTPSLSSSAEEVLSIASPDGHMLHSPESQGRDWLQFEQEECETTPAHKGIESNSQVQEQISTAHVSPSLLLEHLGALDNTALREKLEHLGALDNAALRVEFEMLADIKDSGDKDKLRMNKDGLAKFLASLHAREIERRLANTPSSPSSLQRSVQGRSARTLERALHTPLPLQPSKRLQTTNSIRALETKTQGQQVLFRPPRLAQWLVDCNKPSATLASITAQKPPTLERCPSRVSNCMLHMCSCM